VGSFTPRATVVERLAEREAELLDQPPSSGHVLVALIWDGGGVAAAALRALGLSDAEDFRSRLRRADRSELGMDLYSFMGAAGQEADALGHEYVGTEHQLLAITQDASLAQDVLAGSVRDGARARVHEIIRSPQYRCG
jgi:ATP-dependent Clp protease ATP-binding subunit ClpC